MSETQILNDYQHVMKVHDVLEINKILEDDECKCAKYSRQDRRKRLKNDEYLVRITGMIHCYLYHNIHRRQEIEDTESKYSEIHYMDLARSFIITC